MGQNPATSLNGGLQRRALAKLDWLVVKDNFETETAAFWYAAPEVRNGEMRAEDIQTEVFLFPSAQIAEMEGTFTNTQRWVQWHDKAADPPGDCRSDAWFTHQLALRLKKLYADSDLPRDQGFKALIWDFDYAEGEYPADTRIQASRTPTRSSRRSTATTRDDPATAPAQLRRAQGRRLDHCAPPGSTAASTRARKRTAPRTARPTPTTARAATSAGPMPGPRTAASSTTAPRPAPTGSPGASARSGSGGMARSGPATTCPTSRQAKAPDTPADPNGIGLDAHSGTDPFIMKADGRGWLYAPTGLVDGPLPTHYEALESPIQNPLYGQQINPVLKYWDVPGNAAGRASATRASPIVITTYRLTEHHLSGVMSRWLPWLAELQPELFVEMSPELAGEKGISNLDWVAVTHRARHDPRQGAGHAPDAPAHGRWQVDPPGRDALALGLHGGRDRRRGQRPDRAGRRPERIDPRRQVLHVQRRESIGGHHGRSNGLLHRHYRLHRLQGVRGCLQGVEPAAGHQRRGEHAQRRQLRQHPHASTASTGGTCNSSSSSTRRAPDGALAADERCLQALRPARAAWKCARPARSSAPSSTRWSSNPMCATAAATASARAPSG